VLVFAATNLEIEFLPPLYDTLRGLGRVERLDVLFYCRGGAVTAARRIALMLHGFADRLSFIVPDRCQSSGTILALAAREILAGEAAIFSPVDPRLQAPAGGGDRPLAIGAEDVRLFATMAKDWFGLDEEAARARALSVLADNIFPTDLTAFYRATLEVRAICLELLSLHMPDEAGEAKGRIVDGLLHGHHSHSFPLGRADLARLGLPVTSDPPVEALAWEIAGALRRSIGGAARPTEADDWTDGLLATRDGALRRRRGPGALAPIWEEGATD
jgi:hypothetical protein